MKKFFFSVFLTIAFYYAGAQSQVITIKGDTINVEVEAFLGRELIFVQKVPILNSNKIDVSHLREVNGRIPAHRKAAILRRNPSVKFNSDDYEITQAPGLAYQKPLPPSVYNTKSVIMSGNMVRSAGILYLSGTGASIIGTTLILVSDSDAARYGGLALTICGGIATIVGHVQLINAGNAMNREAVTLSMANNGLGLAINF